jgi:8-amino-7-oxononanoate synthase
MKPSSKKLLHLQDNCTFANLYRVICDNTDAVACEYDEQGVVRKMTYRKFAQITQAAAYHLTQQLGEKNIGCYVGLQLDNCPEWPALFFALLMAGYKPLLLDFRASREILCHLLEEAAAVAIISDDAKFVPPAMPRYRKEELVLPVHDTTSWQPRWAQELALCTSGTTATAKVFVYHETAFIKNMAAGWSVCEESPFLSTEPIKALAFAPFYHIFGFALYVWYSCLGSTIVYLKDRVPSTFLDTCQKQQVTLLVCVPLVWNNLASKITAKVSQQPWHKRMLFRGMCHLSLALQHLFPLWGQHFAYHVLFGKIHAQLMGLHVQATLSGGAYLSPKTIRFLTALGFPLVNGCGMTETGVIAVEPGNSLQRRLHASLGKPLSSLQLKVVGESAGMPGEIYLRGDSLHTGRLQKGKLLPPVRDSEGWFATGDLGQLDANGYLYLLGRCKDTIVPATGEKVYPDEIEDFFRNIIQVEELCVVGIKNSMHGEDTTMVVRLRKDWDNDNGRAEAAAAIGRINRTLPFAKRVSKVLVASAPLPATTSMKTQRMKLKSTIEENSPAFAPLAAQAASGIVPQLQQREAAANEFGKIQEEVRGVFARVLHRPAESIGDDAHFIQELGGDSLSAIQLASELEKQYRIFISNEILLQCSNVKDIANTVVAQLHHGQSSTTSELKATKAPTPRAAITRFQDSREYQAFRQRMEQAGGLNPYFVAHDSVVRDTSWVAGREMINFASYNYVGMSGHPEVAKRAQEAIAKYGTSASGSRLLTGEKSLYRQLERKLAQWKHVDDALVLVSGHATNVTFVGNFCNENDLILYDAFSHNSIEQGTRLSRSDSKAFPHNDFKMLESILETRRNFYEKVLIVIEGVYSMDGDIAPVPEFVKLKKKYGAFLMVDEAHSTGVLGATGRGVDEHFGLAPEDIDIRMGTLSKGLGSCGGYLAGAQALVDYLHYSVPGFVFSVAIPPATAAAALAAVEVLEKDHSAVTRLHNNIAIFLEEAHRRAFHTCLAQNTAILPILVGEDKAAFVLCHKLKEQGVFVVPAVYPAVPRGQARLRFCVTSEHKKEQIVAALDSLQQIARSEGIAMPVYQPRIAMA